MAETWATLEGASLFVETVGEGPRALVMPPACGVSHDFLQALLGELQLPLQLTYFDPEGTGTSSPLPANWNPARVLDEAEAVLQTVAPDRAVIVVGHAGGAFLAMAYALERPTAVSALILISPFAGYQRANDMSVARVESHAMWSAFQRRVAEIRRVKLTPEDRFRAIFKEQRVLDMHEYGPYYFQMADAADESTFNPVMHDDMETDLLDDLAELQAPTLIIVGEDDPLSPLEESRLISAELPFVRLVEFANCGHYPFVEEPDLFTAAVEQFLGEVAEDQPQGA